jgi:hypothetical protein
MANSSDKKMKARLSPIVYAKRNQMIVREKRLATKTAAAVLGALTSLFKRMKTIYSIRNVKRNALKKAKMYGLESIKVSVPFECDL